MAVAWTQRALLEAALAGVLDLNAEAWNITIIERDVPCAAIAVGLLLAQHDALTQLNAGDPKPLPSIRLSIATAEAHSSLHKLDLAPEQRLQVTLHSSVAELQRAHEHSDLLIDVATEREAGYNEARLTTQQRILLRPSQQPPRIDDVRLCMAQE